MAECCASIVNSLSKRVAIQRVQYQADGQGGFEESWADVATVYASIVPLKSYERYQAMQLAVPITHKVVMRYNPDVDETTRLRYGERIFTVKEVINHEEQNRFLFLKVIETDVIDSNTDPVVAINSLTDELGQLITDELDNPIDITPNPVPIITSASNYTVTEGVTLTFAVAADGPVTWSIEGADETRFTLVGNVITLPYQDFETPTDADGDNVYELTVRATNAQGNSTAQAVRVTVTNLIDDITPDAFVFPDVLTPLRDTPFTTETITLSGMNVPANLTITNGLYSLNGGEFTSAPAVVFTGDTIALRATSSSDGTPVVATLTVGTYSTNFGIYDDPNPPVTSGLRLWLSSSVAEYIVSSGGLVSQWTDRSGNGNHLTQGTAVNQPTTGTRTLNGRNALDFDGTNDFMLLPSALHSIPGANNTVFVVALSDTGAGSGGAQALLRGDTTNFQMQFNPGSARIENRNHTSTNVFTTVTKNATANIFAQCRNGSALTACFNTTQTVNASGANNVTVTGIGLGGSATGTQPFNGLIAEVLVYNRALTLAEANQVATFLKDKWNVANFSGSYASGFA
ncbi:phage head closure protein [Tautonia marina]|uniref:phage head closure protein n=1 Tax=Tautonia marina TaxID=2653855 RepID=UPI001260AEF8|nr:phage head closure protein [Tautonia marina]